MSIQHHKENELLSKDANELSRQGNKLSREANALSKEANTLTTDANLIAAENRRVAAANNLNAALMVNVRQSDRQHQPCADHALDEPIHDTCGHCRWVFQHRGRNIWDCEERKNVLHLRRHTFSGLVPC
jgi:hypothetical protein